MNRLVQINRENYKTINWIYAYKVLFKLHSRIVSQIEKKNIEILEIFNVYY